MCVFSTVALLLDSYPCVLLLSVDEVPLFVSSTFLSFLMRIFHRTSIVSTNINIQHLFYTIFMRFLHDCVHNFCVLKMRKRIFSCTTIMIASPTHAHKRENAQVRQKCSKSFFDSCCVRKVLDFPNMSPQCCTWWATIKLVLLPFSFLNLFLLELS